MLVYSLCHPDFDGASSLPELPEVESVVRSVVPKVKGKRIESVEFDGGRVFRHAGDAVPEQLQGRRIKSVERRGKFIVFRLDKGWLVIHLGMTGKIRFDVEPTKWTRGIFHLNGRTMLYDDARMFGTIEWGDTLTQRVERLGPEPFEVSEGEFYERLHRRKAPIKAVLLNQAVIRGLGNIYADEALHRAGIHPNTLASQITKPKIKSLHKHMRKVLQESIDLRGSSIINYADAKGRKGAFQDLHRVYRKTGSACRACGKKIKRIVVGGRSTHFCPACQRA